jgi:hypothetical protein
MAFTPSIFTKLSYLIKSIYGISVGAVRSSNTTRLIIDVFIIITTTTYFGYYFSPSSGCLHVLLDSYICDVIWVGVYRRALERVWVCWGVRWP